MGSARHCRGHKTHSSQRGQEACTSTDSTGKRKVFGYQYDTGRYHHIVCSFPRWEKRSVAATGRQAWCRCNACRVASTAYCVLVGSGQRLAFQGTRVRSAGPALPAGCWPIRPHQCPPCWDEGRKASSDDGGQSSAFPLPIRSMLGLFRGRGTLHLHFTIFMIVYRKNQPPIHSISNH